jgi:hypothetical protein
VLLHTPVPDGGADCGALPTIANVKTSSLAACARFATGANVFMSGTLCSVECDAGFNQLGELLCVNGAWTGGFACTAEPVCTRPDATVFSCPSFTYTASSGLDVNVASQLATAFVSDNSYADDCKVVKLAGATSYTQSGACASSTKVRYIHVKPAIANLQIVLDFRNQPASIQSIAGATVVSNAAGLLTLQLPNANATSSRVTLTLNGALPRPVIRCAQLSRLPRVNGVAGNGACKNFLVPRGTKCKAMFDAGAYGARARRDAPVRGGVEEWRDRQTDPAGSSQASPPAHAPSSRARVRRVRRVRARLARRAQSGAKATSPATASPPGSPTPTSPSPPTSAAATRPSRRPRCSR